MEVKANPFIIALLLLTANANAVWGMGAQENPLLDVDALIVNQRYDEAIRRITEYIKVNPSQFDEAQKRMQRITRIRTAYNNSASALIDVLENDPTNQERKLALIKELESYEREPSPAVKEFVSKTKELALFTYNRAKFEEILSKAKSLIDVRDFISAVRVYESGFALYRTEFANSGFSQAVVDDAFERVATISGEIMIFEAQAKVMDDTFSSLATAIAGNDTEMTSQAWNQARLIATSIAGIRRNIVDQGRMLEAAFVDIVANDPTITENSFLPFAFRLILGRKAEDRLEGIVGAIDALWMSSVGKAQTALDQKLAREAGLAAAAFDSGVWADAEVKYQALLSDAYRGTALLSLWSHYATSDLVERSTSFGRAALALKGTDYLRYAHIASTSRSYSELTSIRKVMDEVDQALELNRIAVGDEAKAVAIASNESLWALLRTATGEIEGLKAGANETAGKFSLWTKAGYGSDLSRIDQIALDARISGSASRSKELEIKAISTAMSLRYSLLLAVTESAKDAINIGKSLLEGVEEGKPQSPVSFGRYPSKALDKFITVKSMLTGLKPDVAAFLAASRTYPAYISEAPGLKESTDRATKLAAMVESGIAEAVMLSTKALVQKRMAEVNKLEAERRIAESRAALGSNNFEAAKKLLEAARDRYRDSLAFEQDSQIKAISDNILMELGLAIRKAENNLIVAETRRHLNFGKNLYYQNEFERAESAILQARVRWSTIFPEPDNEIEYWLKLVQTALTVKSGRSIPVTSPVFPEASRTLSLAKHYFQEGAALLAKRDRTGAVKAFSLATQKIDEIKTLFPLNQEAAILELRIAQLSDPEAFGKKFALMFDESKDKIEAGVEYPSVYNRLKDMESIEPRYPGLKLLIEKTEVLLGFRHSSPDPEKVTQAKALVLLAQGIFDTGRADQYRIAIAQLEKALDLDPNNQDAIFLKDRIATYLGGSPVKVGP